jgi:hypothetical protein
MPATLVSVQQIAEANPDDFEQVTDDFRSFIDLANELVDELCSGNSLVTGLPHSTGRMDKIKTWLAAHFIKILDPQLVREEVSTLRTVYQQEVKLGLDQTRYGQQAKFADTTGGLAAWDKSTAGNAGKPPAKTSVGWLGKPLE